MLSNNQKKSLNNYQELLLSIMPFKNIVCDLWGVIHDGSSLYPGVLQFLQDLTNLNKNIIFLSNAPRRASKAQLILDYLGVKREYYKNIITSGEILFYDLAINQDNNFNKFGKNFYYFGPKKDQDLLLGLNYQSTNITDADFVILTGFHDDAENIKDEIQFIRQIYQRKLTVICANPDLKVVRQNGEESPCAGLIAKYYEEIGGKVIYYGKPHISTYEYLLKNLLYFTNQKFTKQDFIAIGDAIETDIKGASDFGISNIFIMGGIHRNDFVNCANQQEKSNKIDNILAKHNLKTDIVDFFIDNIAVKNN